MRIASQKGKKRVCVHLGHRTSVGGSKDAVDGWLAFAFASLPQVRHPECHILRGDHRATSTGCAHGHSQGVPSVESVCAGPFVTSYQYVRQRQPCLTVEILVAQKYFPNANIPMLQPWWEAGMGWNRSHKLHKESQGYETACLSCL